jgi:hypothetical protein
MLMQRRHFALALGLAALASGCSAADTGSKPGELGNGGFFFSCEDAVSCTPYSDDASKFPKAVSLESTFQVRFEPKKGDTLITFNEQAPQRGLTINPVGEYIARGPAGLVAKKSGYATITSRDAAGRLVDFINIRVAKPDALVVYPADDASAKPKPVVAVSIGTGDSRTYRAFAQEKNDVLGGTLPVVWKAETPGTIDVQSTSDGKVTVTALKAGPATLVATGGTFEQRIPVEVK